MTDLVRLGLRWRRRGRGGLYIAAEFASRRPGRTEGKDHAR